MLINAPTRKFTGGWGHPARIFTIAICYTTTPQRPSKLIQDFQREVQKNPQTFPRLLKFLIPQGSRLFLPGKYNSHNKPGSWYTTGLKTIWWPEIGLLSVAHIHHLRENYADCRFWLPLIHSCSQSWNPIEKKRQFSTKSSKNVCKFPKKKPQLEPVNSAVWPTRASPWLSYSLYSLATAQAQIGLIIKRYIMVSKTGVCT